MGMVTVHPQTTDDVLINPGTGWQLLVARPPAGEMERLPLVSTFYYRTCWTEFEPERGQYESSPAVRTIDLWLDDARRHGRYVAIRVVPWNSRNPHYQKRCAQKVQGYDSPVPPYVFEAGADGFPEPGDSGGWVPVFWDPIYLKHHRELASFLGERYAGDPNIVYIDVPAGNYGEMNLTNTNVPSLDDLSLWKVHGLTGESWSHMLRELCDMYRDAFPHDLLVAARDYAYYEGGKESIPYAVDKGVGFRDDGLGMRYCGPGKENPEYEANWPKVLCLYENGGGSWLNWGNEARVRATLDWAIDRTHASIVMVGKGHSGEESYRRFLPLVQEYGRRVGYRLVVETAEWKESVRPGQALSVALTWRNLGNAPPYVDFAVELSLLASDGEVAASHVVAPAQARTTTWLPEADLPLAAALPVPPDLAPGTYTVAVSMLETLPSADDGPAVRRRIQLGMSGGADGRYVLGELRVE